uniref:T-complex protein 1 subunit beta n=1 Tax=Hirondellea gigas TaxID=1518452 RepID=A0A2P2HYN1_9CRUS
MQPARITPRILKEEKGAHFEKGENARLSSFIGAIAIADLVKTTLGPKGMDKILQSMDEDSGAPTKNITITNDGATILKAVPVDNAAAKILVDVSKTQDSEIGDGTTSVVVLAGELLREAEKLIAQKIHPQTIIRGWRKAVTTAREALFNSSLDHKADDDDYYETLLSIARTSLSSKIVTSDENIFARLCVDAVLRLKGSTNLDSIQIMKKIGGQLKDSYLEEGYILNKTIGVGQPKRVENAKILIANTPMDTDKIKIFGAKIKTDSLAKLAQIEKAEKSKMKVKVEKILKHNIDCFINRQLIYNYPEQLFADAKVTAIEHADFEGIERLALALGGEICSTFDHPELVKLGQCKLIEEIMIGEERVIRFSGVKSGEACTIVLRGASTHLLDEAERSIHDALCVLSQTVRNTRTVYGGGCAETLMAKAVDEIAPGIGGKEQVAVESFARALLAIPAIIANNAGFDSAELVANLRTAHFNKNITFGLNMSNGTIGDMAKLKVVESLKCKMSMLVYAHEAAEMILRVDDIIRCAPRAREPRHPHM